MLLFFMKRNSVSLVGRLKRVYRFLKPATQALLLEYPVDMQPRYGHGKPPHPALYKIINARRREYEAWLDKALIYKEVMWKLRDAKEEKDPLQPAWNNGFLPGLDMVMLYTIMSELRPRQYVEIGSGNSTKMACKAKTDRALDCSFTSIDPKPRAEIDKLVENVVREGFENCTWDIASMLEANDVLFVDNSHRILPNSDAMVFFMELLPKLRRGVVVQIHDVYLPYDYPMFMCNRFYSEQYGLAMFLLANPEKFECLMPCYFVAEDEELSARISPMWMHARMREVERHGGSFWFRVAK